MATTKAKAAAPKKAAPKAKKPAAVKKVTAPKKAAAPRRTAKTIRNLRGTVVHARLLSVTPKDPFRIALNPRGASGDTTTIPVALIDDNTFLAGIGVLWEVITATEARELSYRPVGYLGRTDSPVIIRPEDNTLLTADDWDGKGRRTPEERGKVVRERGRDLTAADREFGTGMHTTDVPGSDTGLHAQLKAAQEAGVEAIPPGVDVSSRRVVVERVRGE